MSGYLDHRGHKRMKDMKKVRPKGEPESLARAVISQSRRRMARSFLRMEKGLRKRARKEPVLAVTLRQRATTARHARKAYRQSLSEVGTDGVDAGCIAPAHAARPKLITTDQGSLKRRHRDAMPLFSIHTHQHHVCQMKIFSDDYFFLLGEMLTRLTRCKEDFLY